MTTPLALAALERITQDAEKLARETADAEAQSARERLKLFDAEPSEHKRLHAKASAARAKRVKVEADLARARAEESQAEYDFLIVAAQLSRERDALERARVSPWRREAAAERWRDYFEKWRRNEENFGLGTELVSWITEQIAQADEPDVALDTLLPEFDKRVAEARIVRDAAISKRQKQPRLERILNPQR